MNGDVFMTTPVDDSTLQAWPPNVPSYRQLRMVSDWASAVRGRELHLEYNEDTGRMKHSAPSTHPPMLLLTPPNAVRPVLARVEFEVRVPGTGVPFSTTLDGDRYSALLWGESAVEKFLFAYYASAAADSAARFLGRLFDAWYGYPDRVVQVCALAFRYGVDAEAGELSLDATVELVCLERNRGGLRLNAMSLGDFERKYPTGAPRGGRVAGTPGKATQCDGWKVAGGTVSSIVAREAAEFVSGASAHASAGSAAARDPRAAASAGTPRSASRRGTARGHDRTAPAPRRSPPAPWHRSRAAAGWRRRLPGRRPAPGPAAPPCPTRRSGRGSAGAG
jgi:hypothetical protein